MVETVTVMMARNRYTF